MATPLSLSKDELRTLRDRTFTAYEEAIKSPEMLSEMEYRDGYEEFHAWTACVFNVVTKLMKLTDVFINASKDKPSVKPQIFAKRWIYWLINEKDYYNGPFAWKTPKKIFGAEYFETLEDKVFNLFKEVSGGKSFRFSFVDAHNINKEDTRPLEGNFVPILKWIQTKDEPVAPEVEPENTPVTTGDVSLSETESQSKPIVFQGLKTSWADIVGQELGTSGAVVKTSGQNKSSKVLEPTPMQMAAAMAFLHSLMGDKPMSHTELSSNAEKLFKMGSEFVASKI
jgi:hypothetical protein